MNTVRWFNFLDTEADFFRVYRAIPGVEFLFSSISSAATSFKFSVSGNEIQEIPLNTTSISTLVSSLNAGKGIVANATYNSLSVQIRLASYSPTARLKIYPNTFASQIGYPTGTIVVPELNFTLISTLNYLDQDIPYVYVDQDGADNDAYRITSVLGTQESLPSIIQKPLLPGVYYCVAEARFINVQGRPVTGVIVHAEPAVLDCSGLSTNIITATSDAYGRVSLPLIQQQYYRINIPAIGFSKFILTPDSEFIDLTAWPATTAPDFSPTGDVP